MKTFFTFGGSVGGSVRETPSTPVEPESKVVVNPDDCSDELDCVAKIEVVSVMVILVVLVCTNTTPNISAIMTIAPITPTVKIFRPEFILTNDLLPYL